MIDQDELRRAIEANQKRTDETKVFLAKMEEKQRAWDERRAFLNRKSFSLPEAFELLGRLEPESLEARHVAIAMLPSGGVMLNEAIRALTTLEDILNQPGIDEQRTP